MHTQHESKVAMAMITKALLYRHIFTKEIYRKRDPAGIEPRISDIHTTQKHLSPLNPASNILIS